MDQKTSKKLINIFRRIKEQQLKRYCLCFKREKRDRERETGDYTMKKKQSEEMNITNFKRSS